MQALAWSPTGRAIAAAGHATASGTVVKLWSFSYVDEDEAKADFYSLVELSGTIASPPASITLNGSIVPQVHALAWSPLQAGKYLASGGNDNVVRVWDVSGRSSTYAGAGAAPFNQSAPVFELKGHTAAINSLSFSVDGGMLASTAAFPDSSIRLWNASTGEALAALDASKNSNPAVDGAVLHGVAWKPSFMEPPSFLATVSSNYLQVWELATAKAVLSVEGTYLSVAWSPSAKYIATGGHRGDVRLWETTAANQLVQIKLFSGHSGSVNSVAWSPLPMPRNLSNGAGKAHLTLASGGDDNTARLWSCFEPGAAGAGVY